MSACCPLLLEGGVRGGREEQCSTYCFYIGCDRFCLATTPRRCAPHPSSPEEGTTLGARMSDHAGCLFNVFARRRGDFAEMMGVRGEGRGACSPELTSSQTSRHAVPTTSTGVFSVFFNIAGGGSLYQRAEVMKPAGAHDGAAQEGNTFGRGTGSGGGH